MTIKEKQKKAIKFFDELSTTATSKLYKIAVEVDDVLNELRCPLTDVIHYKSEYMSEAVALDYYAGKRTAVNVQVFIDTDNGISINLYNNTHRDYGIDIDKSLSFKKFNKDALIDTYTQLNEVCKTICKLEADFKKVLKKN